MFARIRIAPDRIDVTDGAALFAWPLLGIMAAYFGVEAAREWAAAMETGPGIQTLIATGASAATIVVAWKMRRMRPMRCRFDATSRRAFFERRRLRNRERREIGFDEIADVVLREGAGGEGGLMRGIHVVTRAGERIDVVAVDQTDFNRFARLADAIREMVRRPRRSTTTPPPSPPRV